MILADKIIRLRKKNAWSQEELAEKMNVSRQSVSKWEGAQSVPDLEKILQLSKLFGVTTDYLLKDEMEEEEFADDAPSIRRVSLAFAHEFLAWRKLAAGRISAAVFACILSVVPLLMLAGASEYGVGNIAENTAALIGMIILFVMVAAAVVVFVHCGFKNDPYEFLEKEIFETEYGVRGMVMEAQKSYRPTYIRSNIIAVSMCIVSVLVLICSAFTNNEFFAVLMLGVMLVMIAVAVLLFVLVGVRWASFSKLLQEGEYAVEAKRKKSQSSTIVTVYWLLVLAVFLIWSLLGNAWDTSWVIWPVAGVIFAALMAVINSRKSKEHDDK